MHQIASTCNHGLKDLSKINVLEFALDSAKPITYLTFKLKTSHIKTKIIGVQKCLLYSCHKAKIHYITVPSDGICSGAGRAAPPPPTCLETPRII